MRQGAALAFVLTLTCGGSAWAAPSQVALVHASTEDATTKEALTRVRAELSTAGFEVVDVDAPPGSDPLASVEASDRPGHPFAIIRVEPTRGGAAADVWIADRVTGKTLLRHVDVLPSPRAAAVLAVRTLELLRASLLEAELPRPSSDPLIREAPWPEPPPAVMRWVHEADRVPLVAPFAAEAAVGWLYSGDLGSELAPMLRVWWAPWRTLAARGSFIGPANARNFTAADGVATIRQELARFEIVWLPEVGIPWLVPTLSLGVGACHMGITGVASSPYFARSDDTWAGVADAGAGAAFRLGNRVAIVLEGHALMMWPRTYVEIGSARFAATGNAPSAIGTLGGLVAF